MQGKELQKPVFVKVSSLENSRDGYNVYVKVVSAEVSTSNGTQPFDMVKAVVADETGCADAFFKGDNAKLIKKDAVIAIRNGKVRLVKGHISLEVDIFGRITPQKVQINANTTKNISEKQITRRPRQNRPRREDGDRKDNREDRRERNDNREERRPRRQDGERRDRNENREERRPRREDGERRDRNQNREDRGPRRDYGEKKERTDRGGDRDERRGGDRGGDNRPKIEWTKVGAIEPGEEGINMLVKVLSVQPVKNRARVVLGDETGKVKGFLFENEALKVGNTVVIFRADATVVKEHIEINLPRGGKVEQSRNRKITEVDQTVDISAKAWVESA